MNDDHQKRQGPEKLNTNGMVMMTTMTVMMTIKTIRADDGLFTTGLT